MKTNKEDHLQLSLLGFTTFTLKLICSGNKALLKVTLLFITRLFLQSSPEVKTIIIENYLYSIYNFLNDCERRQEIIDTFPVWMRTEYTKMMKRDQQEQDRELVFVLHLN